jgi:hypothetical protein
MFAAHGLGRRNMFPEAAMKVFASLLWLAVASLCSAIGLPAAPAPVTQQQPLALDFTTFTVAKGCPML